MAKSKLELKRWQFTLDQTEYGEGAGWAKPEFDDSRWIWVDAYTSWETYEHGMRDYEGCGWFRTRFPWTGEEGERCVLHFDGVGGVAKVFLNGTYMGGTDDRYVPFEVDVTDAVHSGENLVAVLVDNRFRGLGHLPGCLNIEWQLYGGLTHHIFVEQRSACHLDGVTVKAEADGTAKVIVNVVNRGTASFEGKVKISLNGESELPVSCAAGENAQITFETKSSVTPWSPDCPKLYDFRAELISGTVLDTYETRVGYRTIETKGTRIYLNGEELYVKGVNRYDEYEPYGMCPPEEKIREEFLLMKELGINLIRTHYPQDDVHYRLADELGLMYMIELPINWWFPSRRKTLADYPDLEREAYADLAATFRWFCNHPCWVIWSVSNECGYRAPAAQELFRGLAQAMRDLNCRRLVTCVIYLKLESSEDLDFCDFIGMNYYHGARSDCVWDYSDGFVNQEEDLTAAVELYPDKPHVLTEFGICSVKGLHGDGQAGRFTEEFAETYLPRVMEKQDQYDHLLRGKILWSWADYRHHRGFIMEGLGIGAVYGPWGIVTIDRKPKEGLMRAFQKALALSAEKR